MRRLLMLMTMTTGALFAANNYDQQAILDAKFTLDIYGDKPEEIEITSELRQEVSSPTGKAYIKPKKFSFTVSRGDLVQSAVVSDWGDWSKLKGIRNAETGDWSVPELPATLPTLKTVQSDQLCDEESSALLKAYCGLLEDMAESYSCGPSALFEVNVSTIRRWLSSPTFINGGPLATLNTIRDHRDRAQFWGDTGEVVIDMDKEQSWTDLSNWEPIVGVAAESAMWPLYVVQGIQDAEFRVAIRVRAEGNHKTDVLSEALVEMDFSVVWKFQDERTGKLTLHLARHVAKLPAEPKGT